MDRLRSFFKGSSSGDDSPEEREEKSKRISVRRRANELLKNFIIVGAYLLIGGLIFMAVESGPEEKAREEDWKVLDQLKINGGVSLGSDDPRAVAFREALSGLNGGCSFKPKEADYDWDFQGSMFFALTVVTTIGYGNFSPTTLGGQWLVVIYAFFGISLILTFIFQSAHLYVMIVRGMLQRCGPLNITTKKGFVNNLSFDSINTSKSGEVDARELRAALEELSDTENLDESVVAYCMYKADPQQKGTLDKDELLNAISVFLQVWPTIPKGADLVMMCIASIAIFLWIVIWGSAIGSIEDWTFRDGVWYGFITLTTIGFGDKAPETHRGRMLAFAFIFIGMGFVAWFVQSIIELYQRVLFWKMQRLYEKGWVSEKYMEINGYDFQSPLGIPRRAKILVFESSKAPRPPVLTREYQAMIDSRNPRFPKNRKDPKECSSGDGIVVDINEDDVEYRPLQVDTSNESLLPRRKSRQQDKAATSPPRRKESKGDDLASPMSLPSADPVEEKPKDDDTNPLASPTMGPKKVRSVKKKKKPLDESQEGLAPSSSVP
eukprot:TRINITY_DN20919_c0_g1_i1.p1 TRINITY_DN20919_c0_g1~~TRINITY_DN20919_c0_g1_i1.p1  ORF type:complete len:549 (+),score=226.29 TRINITY_DN20919_c0_g1_i1:186-1832(+)